MTSVDIIQHIYIYIRFIILFMATFMLTYLVSNSILYYYGIKDTVLTIDLILTHAFLSFIFFTVYFAMPVNVKSRVITLLG